jgi:hypothetical protein
VLVGVSVMVVVNDPVFQLYESAPEAVNIADRPTHITVEDAVTIGIGFTTMVPEPVFTQPYTEVPVTLYVVVVDGDCVMPAVVAPVFHK